MFGLFSTKPLLDEGSTLWIFEAYAWAFRNFGSDILHHDTILVTPSNRHFPEQARSAEEIVSTSFQRVIAYAGMQNWPCQPVPVTACSEQPVTAIQISHAPRGPAAAISVSGASTNIPVAFDAHQVRKPHVLIAIFAQELAKHLGATAQEIPPGGEQLRPVAYDLLAVFMGFGLFLANSALEVGKGGCSGCGVSVQRLGNLTEEEATYALAVFCALKDIQADEVEPHLKKTLRAFFRKAVKEITHSKTEQVLGLRNLKHPLKPALSHDMS